MSSMKIFMSYEPDVQLAETSGSEPAGGSSFPIWDGPCSEELTPISWRWLVISERKPYGLTM